MIVFDIMCQRYVLRPELTCLPLAVALCVALACLTGCQSTSQRRHDQVSRVVLTAFLDRLELNAKRLEQLDSRNLEAPLAISSDARKTIQGAVSGFSRAYHEYRDLLVELNNGWGTMTVARLRVALQSCETITGRLAEDAATLSHSLDGANDDFEATHTGGASSGVDSPVNLTPSREYLEVCRRIARLMSSVEEYLGEVHAEALRKGVTADRFGAGVFHFLRLQQMRAPWVEGFTVTYETAWKKWIEWQVGRSRPDEAMAIFALVARASPGFRPATLQSLVDITNGCLKKAPMLEVVQGMLDAFERIEAIYESGDTSGDQRRQLIQTKGTLLFCQARQLDNDREAATLSTKALTLNPYLHDHVTRFLLRRARRAAQKCVAKNEFSEAINAFRMIISSGPARNGAVATRRFRDKVVASALRKAEHEIEKNRFASARRVLTRVTKVEGKSLNRRKITEAFRKYYRSYSNYVLQRDVDRGLRIAREGLDVFPQDAVLKQRFDRGVLLRLKNDVGDIGTSFERLSPSKILNMLGEAVSEMRLGESANLCHAFKREIGAMWDRRARNEDVSIGFELAVGSARLDGKGEEKARRHGARLLTDLFDSAVARRRWDKAEQCVEAWFASCPDIERPDSFKWNYVRLIDHLETTNEVRRLGRHLAIFVKVYEAEAERYRTTIAKYVSVESREGRGFYTLLKTLAPESAKVRAIESEPASPVVKEDLAVFMDEQELRDTEGWWAEPVPTPEEDLPDDAVAAAPPSFAESFGAMSIAGGGIGALGSLVLVAALAGRRSRKKPVPFSCYAAVAVAVGLTVGFVLGARETTTAEASMPRGTAASVSQNE